MSVLDKKVSELPLLENISADALVYIVDGDDSYKTTISELKEAVSPDAFDGATASTAGTKGAVPAPSVGDEDKVLRGDGTWGDLPSGASVTEIWSGTGSYGNDIVLSEDVSSDFTGIMLFEFGSNANSPHAMGISIGSLVFSGNIFTVGCCGQTNSWAKLQYVSETHTLHVDNEVGYNNGTINKIYKVG